MDLSFYKNRRILVTGHTGFKGAWLCKVLLLAQADVTGYALPAAEPSLFHLLGLSFRMDSVIGDIRDYDKLSAAFDNYMPEIVIHLAAQPIVRTSYAEPRMTYETNVMGTVNICECVRLHPCVKSFLNVTTDKVYKNREWCYGYRENEMLDGYDPYSNSKSCSELVTHSYINSFFNDMEVAVSTARAGNVIGGGDFAKDRIIPDCVRAAVNHETVVLRNPNSVRPYQHVLEPVHMYLEVAAEQLIDKSKAGCYNIGPDGCDCITTKELAGLFQKYYGRDFSFRTERDMGGPHEADYLRLDTGLVKKTFGWKPRWNISEAVKRTVEWTKEWMRDDSSENMNKIAERQILDFIGKGSTGGRNGENDYAGR